ncbi:MAG: hypothetical protein PQ612_04285 [Rickettsiales bacterium]|nr:hypothetical protein [Pseudomonadota bacterium]MDA0966168.1 hypothetical protein [Pseudomonadota bacterium]MDG4543167.1 hypothetical protein [Rickettsiales bacterium]MDG4545365.1 hypothetical protein [Rickettsiales bacterium]MDG4547814.1 hypothetical protein [Rickettsiales bacterium]
MPDLIDEIKEDIKQERLTKLWQDTGTYIIGGIILTIAVTAGNVFYKSYKKSKYENLGTELYSAYVKESINEPDKSIDAYDNIAKNSDTNISAIADIRKAALLDKAGKNDLAIQLYKDISENNSYPIEFRELAEILYLRNAIEFSEQNDISLINRLEDISKSNGPFRYSAKEMLAFALYESLQYNDAKKLFTELSEEEATPATMRSRANEMVNAINIESEDTNG